MGHSTLVVLHVLTTEEPSQFCPHGMADFHLSLGQLEVPGSNDLSGQGGNKDNYFIIQRVHIVSHRGQRQAEILQVLYIGLLEKIKQTAPVSSGDKWV